MKSLLGLSGLLFLITNFVCYSNTHIFDWFVPASDENRGTEMLDFDSPRLEKTKEEKFLDEAKEYLKLSLIDVCQHKIFLKLKTSCSLLSEEALLKISVNLLNCQSEAEGRKTVLCTEKMTLKECTKAMDTSTWNLYHMISVRAKSVCYMVRQQQFNAYSDIMLSRLVKSAQDQITTMGSLEEGQEKLKVLAQETFSFLSNAQEHLKMKQTKSSTQRNKLEEVIAANLQTVKAIGILLVQAQEHLIVYIDKVNNAFDASGPTHVNSTDIKIIQLDVLSVFNILKNKSQQHWKKIETDFSSLETLFQKLDIQNEVLQHKVDMVENAMNCIIGYLKNLFNTVENVTSKSISILSWFFSSGSSEGDITSEDKEHNKKGLYEALTWSYIQQTLLILENLLLWILFGLDVHLLAVIIFCDSVMYAWYLKYILQPFSVTTEMVFIILGEWLFLAFGKHLISTKFMRMVNIIKIFFQNIVGTVKDWVTLCVRRRDWNNALTYNPSRSTPSPDRSPSPPRTRSCTPLLSPSPSQWPSSAILARNFHSSTPVISSRESAVSQRCAPSSYISNRDEDFLSNSGKPCCIGVCKSGKLCRNLAVAGEVFCRLHIK